MTEIPYQVNSVIDQKIAELVQEDGSKHILICEMSHRT